MSTDSPGGFPRRAWRRARHRARQFFGALRPRVSAADRREAYAHLDAPLQRLFESMTLRDQEHGIVVCRRVRSAATGATAGSGDPALLVAALLHDCGKGRVAVWHRVVHVLLGALAPALRPKLAAERSAGWRQALWRLLHHPEIGADMAQKAGASDDVVRMIRLQDAPASDARLALLQAADDA